MIEFIRYFTQYKRAAYHSIWFVSWAGMTLRVSPNVFYDLQALL